MAARQSGFAISLPPATVSSSIGSTFPRSEEVNIQAGNARQSQCTLSSDPSWLGLQQSALQVRRQPVAAAPWHKSSCGAKALQSELDSRNLVAVS